MELKTRRALPLRSGMGRIRCAVPLIGLLAAGFAAQGIAAPEPARCWRGRPLPECRSFWITEFGFGQRLNASSDPDRAGQVFDQYVVYDVGWMTNRNARTAWGGTVSLKGMGETHLGLNGRLRRWMGESWAVDFSPGVILVGSSNDDAYHLEYPTVSCRLRLSYGDWFGFSGGLELARIRDGGSEVDGFAGVELGSYGGVGVGLVFAVLSVLAARSLAAPP